MILRNYPDSFPDIKKNFIVHFTTTGNELKNHTSPLSIKCCLKGFEDHKTSDGLYRSVPGNYLIVNEGQRCESIIRNTTETFSVYFDSGFVEEVLKNLVTSSDKILSFSYFPVRQPVLFFEKTYPHNSAVSPVLMKLRLASQLGHDDEEYLRERYYEILENLLLVHRDLYEEIEKLPPVKLSTKTELYKRICRAKEYIDASYSANITLEKVSREACLSQFHFLRLFKTIFKETPHQYLTKKRIGKALSLLRSTEKSITEICFDIGFESVGSFSTLFRKKFGISPEVCRDHFRRYHAKYR